MARGRLRLSLAHLPSSREYEGHIRLWLSRLVVGVEALANQVISESSENEPVRKLLGLAPESGELIKREALNALRKLVFAAERNALPRKGRLFENIDKFATLLNLNAVEKDVLAFAALAKSHTILKSMLGVMYQCSNEWAIGLIALALRYSPKSVGEALQAGGALAETRLLMLQNDAYDMDQKLELKDGFENVLLNGTGTLEQLLSAFFREVSAATIAEADFAHVRVDVELLKTYLRNARREGREGVNVLFYGPPGTGKTQLAKVIATALGLGLYEVRSENEKGEVASILDRLSSYKLCQKFLQRGRCGLVLFDEIEDLFPADEWRYYRTRISKAWVNALLESNPVPTIWVSNDVRQIEAAYLRRFDYSLQLEIAPRRVRERILRRQLKSHRIGNAAIKRLASLQHLSPAVVDRALRVVRGVRAKSTKKVATLERVVGNSLRLMGLPDRVATDAGAQEFSLRYANADMDLARLTKRLKNSVQHVAMCLYGEPGTGKSAFANFLANEIGKPLHKQRASDLLSPWVGMNERNIAAMFRRAERERAVLLLDEADSFLTQRGVGAQSWEGTLVNEMLTQMESFAGIFICSTNLIDRLDEASLRRFALKIKFDFLTREQRENLLRSHFPLLGEKQLAGGVAAIAALDNLAVGDFVTVRRQIAVTGESLAPEAFVERLRLECEAKRSSRSRPIGF